MKQSFPVVVFLSRYWEQEEGLEWKALFIVIALDGRFPSQRSVDDPEELEEELRLFYVACTRAKDHLFIDLPPKR